MDIIERHQTLEKLILEGKVKDQRNRGRPKRSWEKDVKNWMEARVWIMGQAAEDRLMYRRSTKAARSENGYAKERRECEYVRNRLCFTWMMNDHTLSS